MATALKQLEDISVVNNPEKETVVIPTAIRDEYYREGTPRRAIEDFKDNGDPSRGVYRNSFRLGRFDFSRFSVDQVDSWIYRCEHYFEIDESLADTKLRITVINLEDEALH